MGLFKALETETYQTYFENFEALKNSLDKIWLEMRKFVHYEEYSEYESYDWALEDELPTEYFNKRISEILTLAETSTFPIDIDKNDPTIPIHMYEREDFIIAGMKASDSSHYNDYVICKNEFLDKRNEYKLAFEKLYFLDEVSLFSPSAKRINWLRDNTGSESFDLLPDDPILDVLKELKKEFDCEEYIGLMASIENAFNKNTNSNINLDKFKKNFINSPFFGDSYKNSNGIFCYLDKDNLRRLSTAREKYLKELETIIQVKSSYQSSKDNTLSNAFWDCINIPNDSIDDNGETIIDIFKTNAIKELRSLFNYRGPNIKMLMHGLHVLHWYDILASPKDKENSSIRSSCVALREILGIEASLSSMSTYYSLIVEKHPKDLKESNRRLITEEEKELITNFKKVVEFYSDHVSL